MDVIDRFLTDYAIPERRDLLMDTYNQLVYLGHHDHELNCENLVSLEGSYENGAIVMLVEDELLKACQDLTLKYFIVCRKADQIRPYLNLLEFLHYMENSIESETIVYHVNEELTAYDQLMSWVEIFRPDIATEIGDLMLDVMQSLIDNIVEMHDLKVDLEPVENDLGFDHKLKYLRALRVTTNRDIMAIDLIKKKKLKTTLSIEQLSRRFIRTVHVSDALLPEDTALNVISLAMMSTNDIGSINHDSKTLVNLMYTDVKRTMALVNDIDQILDQAGELCKIMSTI